MREGGVFLGANGELSTFVSSERVEFPEGITVYNFTVEGNHNYFVIAETDEFGQASVLVHNQGNYTEKKEPWPIRWWGSKNPYIKDISFADDKSATITLDRPEDVGRIYILYGHGIMDKPNTVQFEKDTYLKATFIMCHAGQSNEKILPKHRIPNYSTAVGETAWGGLRGRDNRQDPKQNEYWLEKVLEEAKKIAKEWLDGNPKLQKVEIIFGNIEKDRPGKQRDTSLRAQILEGNFPSQFIITIERAVP